VKLLNASAFLVESVVIVHLKANRNGIGFQYVINEIEESIKIVYHQVI